MNLNTVNIIKKIDKNSVESVKDAIFQRAQEKNSNVQANVRNDVMVEARAQVNRSSSNPFAQGIFTSAQSAPAETAVASDVATKTSSPRVDTGRKISQNISLQTGMYNSAMRESVMIQASENMVRNNDLMSRLTFLNTQTAISSYPAKKF